MDIQSLYSLSQSLSLSECVWLMIYALFLLYVFIEHNFFWSIPRTRSHHKFRQYNRPKKKEERKHFESICIRILSSLSGTLAGVKRTAQIMKRKRQRVSTFPGKWCKISGIHIYIFSRRLQFGKLKRERNLLESIRHIICIAFIYGRTRTTFLFRWFAYSELYALLAYLEQLFFSVLFAKGNRYTHANQQHWAVAGAHFQR